MICRSATLLASRLSMDSISSTCDGSSFVLNKVPILGMTESCNSRRLPTDSRRPRGIACDGRGALAGDAQGEAKVRMLLRFSLAPSEA